MSDKHKDAKQELHKQGYAPQPQAPEPKTWRAPELTEQEQQERNQLIESGEIPF